jgi:anti-sigma regulatory factor (Ser/Thr protein kinase)
VGNDDCSRPTDFQVEVPATADQLANIRAQLFSWLERLGVPNSEAMDIVLAVNEACSNCIEHAYRDIDTGVIQVGAALESGRIVVCVADFGFWRTPSDEPTTRGRGLPIMEAMSDDVSLASGTSGTTVRFRFDTAGDFRAAAAGPPERRTHRSDAQRS